MESLDTSTDNALQIFKEIAKDNQDNVKSVEKQVVMTEEITKLINKAELDTHSAIDRTYDSLKEMEKSRQNLDELKEQSNEIMNYNNHVLETITEFVENSKIDDTVDSFDAMEKDMKGLDEDMKNQNEW